MKVRYTGQLPLAFVALGREIQPGEEFPIPDDDADAYVGRDDIEQVPDEVPPRGKSRAVQPKSPDALNVPEPPAAQAPDDTATA